MITNQGYRIEKEQVSEDVLDKLIVKKQVSKNFADTAHEYNILRQSEKYYYLPRYFGIKEIGPAEINIPYKKINVHFNGILRDQQQEIINVIMPKLLKNYGGIITLPCGFGKTVLALYIICQLKVKTLILVHQNNLLTQWIERIKQYIQEYSGDNPMTVGRLQQDLIETDKDIVIGMIQTLSSKRNYTRDQLKDFGLIIVDECHHIAAEVFCTGLDKLNAKYILGLSATPTRKDGLTKILKWYLGDFLYKIECRENKSATIFKINYESTDPLFKEEMQKRGWDTFPSTPKMITNLTKIKERNDLIINILVYYANLNRNILILSERVDHLIYLKETFDKLTNYQYNTGLYIGKTNKVERERIEKESKIIFGINKIAQEGLDIKRLDTLIMASPQKDITQPIGRVMRQQNITSHIIDISDRLSVFCNYSRIRDRIYRKGKYQVKTLEFQSKDLNKYKVEFEELFNRCEILEIEYNSDKSTEQNNNKNDDDNDDDAITDANYFTDVNDATKDFIDFDDF